MTHNQNLPSRIAWRYLKSKKSHSTVTVIAVVAICGVAVATAAIICVLSVFNGFRDIMAGRLDNLSPDVIVTPMRGKVMSNPDSVVEVIKRNPKVEIAMETLTDNALALFDSREMPVTLKGVDFENYGKLSNIHRLLTEGSVYPQEAIEETVDDYKYRGLVSIGMAIRLNIQSDEEDILLFAPRREGRVNLSNPAASFITDSLTATGIFQTNQSEIDESTVIVPIELARDMFQYEGEASAIEIKVKPGYGAADVGNELKEALGQDFQVKDRLEQQEVNFRMISIEKWVTFLMLFFILVIASFNIISTLSMLVIEKRNSNKTLHSLGMSKRQIGRIFWWESVYITILGGGAGIVLGVVLCLLQEHFQFIRMNGDPSTLIVSAYPVAVEWMDILITMIPIMLIGLVSAWITSQFAKGKLRNS